MSTSTPVLDEEARALLRRILESQGFRQLAAIDILGHSLKFFPDLDSKLELARELEESLVLYRQVQGLHRELGWQGLEEAVRGRVERIPYPSSRLELALCRRLCTMAERAAMRAYVESNCAPFAAIARAYLAGEQSSASRELERFAEYCGDASHRPHAQQVLGRWTAVALRALGRPHTHADARALALGLRSQSCAQVAREFLAELDPLIRRFGLERPDFGALSLELPRPGEA
jgi:hypothetical protein